jgi:hypothetical protein
MRYAHYLDAVSMAVDELLVPAYMDLLSLLSLLHTSKQLRNKINARPCIAQHIRAAVGIPIERARHPIKVLTFFKIRSGAIQSHSSILTEYWLAMRHACIGCLTHGLRTRRAYRKGEECELLFTNGLDECQTCKTVPIWSQQRRTCKDPSHDSTKRRGNNQLLCNECFAKA